STSRSRVPPRFRRAPGGRLRLGALAGRRARGAAPPRPESVRSRRAESCRDRRRRAIPKPRGGRRSELRARFPWLPARRGPPRIGRRGERVGPELSRVQPSKSGACSQNTLEGPKVQVLERVARKNVGEPGPRPRYGSDEGRGPPQSGGPWLPRSNPPRAAAPSVLDECWHGGR